MQDPFSERAALSFPPKGVLKKSLRGARRATKQSVSCLIAENADCFATLAMTGYGVLQHARKRETRKLDVCRASHPAGAGFGAPTCKLRVSIHCGGNGILM